MAAAEAQAATEAAAAEFDRLYWIDDSGRVHERREAAARA
jgi:hypothetical protein